MKTLKLYNILSWLGILSFFAILLTSCEKGPSFREFNYPELTVNDFSPSAGRPGYQITINGTNFGDVKKAVTVYFNGVAATQDDIVSVTDKQIVVTVPKNATSGKIKVKVWQFTKEISGDFSFIPGGEISNISPGFGLEGSIVTILGKNFGTIPSDIKVTFGGVNAEVTSITDTKIEVKVPKDGVTGLIKLYVGLQEIEGIYFLVGEEKLTGTIIGTPGSWSNNPATTIAAAFDGNVTTFVDGAVASGYLGFDLGATTKAKLNRMRYYPRTGNAARMNGARVYGTNDPDKVGTTNGDLLYTITTAPIYDWNVATINSSTSYRYLYLYFSTGNLNVSELEFYGVKDN